MSQPQSRQGNSLGVIIAAGAFVLAISFGVRAIFGIVLDPMSTDLGWPRETFAFSVALQNIVWGLAQPVFGAVADRVGDRKAMWIGFGFYAAGMVLSGLGTTPFAQHMGAGVLVGLGISGTAFGLVLAVVGRAAPPEKRSQALGLTAAFGGLGQLVMPLVAQWLVREWDWQVAVLGCGLFLLPIALCIPLLKAGVSRTEVGTPQPTMPLGELLRTALTHRSYLLLVAGFFVCGYHLAFISTHFPAYVAEMCVSLSPDDAVALGAAAISIIGAANVIGTFAAGKLGAMFPKPYVLSAIYALRALAIVVFISLPVTPASVIAFSAAMGVLWLSTVPLTSGLVATMFGPANMGTLYGIVFLSHQVGSFVGVWMGGRVYDLYGSYDLVWWLGIALGVASAIVHLPVKEREWSPAPA